MTNKKFLLAVGFATLIAAMVIGFRIKAGGEGSSSPVGNRNQVKTVPAETVPIKKEVTVSGTVVARQTAVISAQVSGYLADLRVSPGDHVKAGQVLLRIDTQELAEREAQAKAALDGAKATLANAKKDFDRYTPLFKAGAISKQQYDEIRTRYEVAQAAEQRAQAALNESKEQLSYGKVRSPFDGIVSDRSVNVGDLVMQGRSLLTVYVPSTLELVVPVGEQYVRYLEEGTQVTVNIPSIEFHRSTDIREVVPQTNEQARTITVKAPLPDFPGLAPGLYGTLYFNTVISEVIAVPSKAVHMVGQLESVRVLKDGRIESLYVKTGRKLNSGKIEILSGLKPGELVVMD
jgi:RND family efflux transporter MFP subunit